jgi:hypothetical protein
VILNAPKFLCQYLHRGGVNPTDQFLGEPSHD